MQTRNELYEFLDYNSYEEKLDKLLRKTKVQIKYFSFQKYEPK